MGSNFQQLKYRLSYMTRVEAHSVGVCPALDLFDPQILGHRDRLNYLSFFLTYTIIQHEKYNWNKMSSLSLRSNNELGIHSSSLLDTPIVCISDWQAFSDIYPYSNPCPVKINTGIHTYFKCPSNIGEQKLHI